MTKPILQVIDGGALLSPAEIDAATASVPFGALFDGATALQVASTAEHDCLEAAELASAASPILAKSKPELVAMISAAGSAQAAEAHKALRRALAGAGALVAILRAAEARFAVARAAAACITDHSR